MKPSIRILISPASGAKVPGAQGGAFFAFNSCVVAVGLSKCGKCISGGKLCVAVSFMLVTVDSTNTRQVPVASQPLAREVLRESSALDMFSGTFYLWALGTLTYKYRR